MKRYTRYAIPSVVLVVAASAAAALVSSDGDSTKDSAGDKIASQAPPACHIRMTRGLYGFQCHGSAFTGTALEPVTFVGTVAGDGRGFFEGFGTFNSSNGSASTHVAGRGNLGPMCLGHVDYTTNEILLPQGGTVPLPPISFDYATVHGGDEILGTGVAPPGVTGDVVPRLTCRLVRVVR
jgi:hypothetical protein